MALFRIGFQQISSKIFTETKKIKIKTTFKGLKKITKKVKTFCNYI